MKDRINFVVGSEIRLKDILHAADVLPLLKTIITAGPTAAAVTDEKGNVLWSEGDTSNIKFGPAASPQNSIAKPVYHEGETIGFLSVLFPDPPRLPKDWTDADLEFKKLLMDISAVSLNIMAKNTAKRIMTTELHTTVVEQSYEELLETNKKLTLSEKRYRELAETLEIKVEERTAELKKAHTMLLQQEKMASVGQLAAGVAHEINNPIGFINSNINTLAKYANNLQKIIQFYKNNGQKAGSKEAEELYAKLRIDFILNDINDLIKQSREGADRIKNIVANLKDFSHIDETSNREIDINTEIENTINVLSHEIKTRSAKIVKDFGYISGFYGNPGMLCQVFLNIMLNALQSKDENLSITIKTEQYEDTAIISIADNGIGIPLEIQSRIFEPFFSTRGIGKGTGLGLTMAYEIISANKGTIEVSSEAGKGAAFTIKLPLKERLSSH